MKFGQRIKDLRTKKGLTLDQLAQETGSSKSYIWELENKNPPRPSAEKISKIASVLGVTSDYLVDEEESIPTADAVDQAFFRKYRKMDPNTKERIPRMVALWGDDEK